MLRSAMRPACFPLRTHEHIRHHSLFAPRDFDVSPYFQVVKPLLEGEFDYRDLTWEDQADCGGAF